MKDPIFEFPSFRYEIPDWDFKKKGLINKINKSNFERTKLQPFETNRQTDINKSWVHYLQQFLKDSLTEFCKEVSGSCYMTDAWCVRYQKGDYQIIHNHRGWGFSGILYVEFDPKVHTPTCFVAPWQDPRTDRTLLSLPKNVKEGILFIAPSFTHHFVHPNQVRKPRTVIAFDLLPELPEHQSLNKNV